MFADAQYTFADPDLFGPLADADPGRRFEPGVPPVGWRRRDRDVWSCWEPPGVVLPAQGWKVHVSASLANAQVVLDVVTAACVRLAVPFKHLAGRDHFLRSHGKHANRVQSGKFCAAYPATADAARELMVDLERDLAGVAGPYVLTDRRFGESRCVSYRYGAFVDQGRVEADGTWTHTTRTPDGLVVLDERRPEFRLPHGVVDPFAPAARVADDEPVAFRGYTFEAVLQHSNAGGAYRARTGAGQAVFIKEARAHNGYLGDGRDAQARLEHEYLVLRAVHAAAPGLCPQPLDHFTHWEHTYLVTEHIPGKTLRAWTIEHAPAIRVAQPRTAFADYYRRGRAILDQVENAITRLHALGYVFVDLQPGNIMVDDDDNVRLVDFEAARSLAEPFHVIGDPGYLPPRATVTGPTDYDRHGLAAIAQLLVFPLHPIARRCPEVLDHLRAGLTEFAPVPDRLWRAVTRHHPRTAARALPSPAAVVADPESHLRWLRERTAAALAAAADLDRRRWTYPPAPDGLRTNTVCVGHGTAGVLHALRAVGEPVDPRIVGRVRDQALAESLPPGLFLGTAGVAWVLADLGEDDAAARLLAAANEHPLVRRSGTLGGGAAGVAMAELAAYGRTADPNHLDRASQLLERVPDGEPLVDWLGADDASGLANGRTGIALALYYLARFTGDGAHLDRGFRLLREELAHSRPWPTDAIGFHPSRADHRNLPYLHTGSAGYAHVLARYLSHRPEPDLAPTLDGCLRALTVRFTATGGLFQGQAGLAFVLADLAHLLDRPELALAATDSGRALFQYATPGPTGVSWSGGLGSRLSADLWTGAAGVLLTLHRLLSNQTDLLFTLDAAVSASPPHVRHRTAVSTA
ncbi:tRNA A-37 threonylcarbamoyl transferase component Bud32 [Actinokineospora baliensis]|uniref:class III lanthionine synthetase LanKC n=1 Tax=Actinokineospora baliensis TaxID=547056 RepID=UPI001956692E|nr:class III lanthionine synthetase LanKC [Actinokineospora baliensis]MBM7774730.1 tRNA A-37 threonylcarbamoyl transferase component Bud32 [Actinokineospora baliensis]